MKSKLAIGIAVVIGLVLGFAYHVEAENAGATRPALLRSAPTFTKRSVTNSAVTDLCTATGTRECVVMNRTDATLCMKAPASDPTCGSTTIDCTGDTDLIIIPPGESWVQVFHDVSGTGVPDTSDSTLCGKMAASPTGDCATPAVTTCVYSAEAK